MFVVLSNKKNTKDKRVGELESLEASLSNVSYEISDNNLNQNDYQTEIDGLDITSEDSDKTEAIIGEDYINSLCLISHRQ